MATQILSGRERFIAPDPVATANPSFSENLLTLCASAIFAGLSPRELMEILSCARMRTFARDEVLYSQGQTARGLIVLQSGSVKHTQLSSNGDEVLLRMSGNGEAVNLQTGPTGCNHTCSARAMEHCRAWVWEFREIATEKVARRLALVLLRLMKQLGKKTSDGTQVSMSREELAQMTGTTLFTISRVLSRWADQGLVASRREAVIILDADRLGSVSEEMF